MEVALALFWAACGSASPPCARSASGRAPHEVRLDENDIRFVPPFEGVRWIGSADAILGGMRAEVGPDGALFAEDAFAAEIDAVLDCGGAWGFRARGGSVASAESFTGPLERRDAAWLAHCSEKPSVPPPEDAPDLVEALLAERPSWRIAAKDAFFPFAGGLVVLEDDAWVVRSETDGSVVSALDARFEECAPERWGEALAMTCGEGARRLFRSRDGRTFETIAVPRGVRPTLLSDDGESAWSNDACPGPDARDGLHHFCARTGGAWKDIALEAGWREEPTAMHGPLVTGAGEIVDVQTGDRCVVEVAGDCSPSELRWTPDGALYGSVQCGRSQRWATGKLPEALRTFDAPRGASEVRFVDADRGVAAGSGRVWRTTDGGETWSEIDLGIEGTIDLGAKIECWEARCLVGDRVIVQGWDREGRAPGRVF